MKRAIILTTLTVMLTGCHPSWQDFSGNNRGEAELRMDIASCQLDSQSAPQTDSSQCQNNGCRIAVVLGNAVAQGNAFNLCMQSRGWQKVQAPTTASQFDTADKQAVSECPKPTAADSAPEVEDCITKKERPVIAIYNPDIIDLYDTYRAKVADDADDYANGDISRRQYTVNIAEAKTEFFYDVRERRASGKRLERVKSDSNDYSDVKPVHLSLDPANWPPSSEADAAKAVTTCKTSGECDVALKRLNEIRKENDKNNQ